MTRNSKIASLIVSLAGVLPLLPANSAEVCGSPFRGPGQFGPFDYTQRDALNDELFIVEAHHFTPYMEDMAINGFSSLRAQTIEEQRFAQGIFFGDLDYTLRAFPNHHRALNAMAAWQLRLRRESAGDYGQLLRSNPAGSAECYFERAAIFAPTDGMVYLSYGVTLHRLGRLEEAAQRYQRALDLMPSSAETHYNLGLLFFDQGKLQAAAREAASAYDLGYPLQGLKRKLERAGVTPE